jgi:hypothetical protein
MNENYEEGELLRAKLNGETSRLPWKELERFFAAGIIIVVRDELDLVEVATRIASDDKNAVAQWLAEGSIGRVNDEQARVWHDADASLWTVVVKPWILVQQEKAPTIPKNVH